MANEWVKALGVLYNYKPNEKYNQEDIDDVCCFLEGLEGIQPYVPEFVAEWIDESFENKELSENIQYHWEMGDLPQEIDDWYSTLSGSDKEEMDANLGNGCTVGFDKLNGYYFERNKENPNGNNLPS